MDTPRRLSRARLAGGCVVIFLGVVVLVLAALVLLSALEPEPGDDHRTMAGTVVFVGIVGSLVVAAGVVVLRRRPPEPAANARVRLWVHGRFGYQDVVLLSFPIAGTALILGSMLAPTVVSSLPQQAGTFAVTACGYVDEEDRDSYTCAGVFEPAAGDPWTLPPHLWLGEGELPDPGDRKPATLLSNGGVVVGEPEISGAILALGLILGGVGLPILVMYLRSFSRFLSLRRRYPGVDVVERGGWRSAGGGSETSRAHLRGQAKTKAGVLGLFLSVLTVGILVAGGFTLWDRFAPGRVAASVTVDRCTDSGDLSGPGFRPLVTCTATASDGSLVEFTPESRIHLPAGEVVSGEIRDGAFIDRSVGILADPLMPALAVMAGMWVLMALVLWANVHEVRRLQRGEPSTRTEDRRNVLRT
ncbi:hypothetical protein [Mycetocola sp. 2940]|uniref:hypothetical protein n=1 Tax=Mycetocola sp. 2940 TaxID=3156452 RepID=UPI003391F6E3